VRVAVCLEQPRCLPSADRIAEAFPRKAQQHSPAQWTLPVQGSVHIQDDCLERFGAKHIDRVAKELRIGVLVFRTHEARWNGVSACGSWL